MATYNRRTFTTLLATAAILLAAFEQHGIQPGPLLFDSNPELVWGLIASLYIGNAMLLVLNLPMAGVWVKLLKVPRARLYGGILLFACTDAYTLNSNIVDVPTAPCIVGLILGPLAEQQFRRALTISQGDLTVLVIRPLSLSLLMIAVLLVLVPVLLRCRGARGEAAVETAN